MPTRFWFSSDSGDPPAVDPGSIGGWIISPGNPTHLKLNLTKGSSARSGVAISESFNASTGNDIGLNAVWVSEPLGAQTLSGTFKAYLQAYEDNAAANWCPTIKIARLNEAGVYQGMLYSGATCSGSAGEFATVATGTNRRFPNGGATVSGSLANGDRIAIMVGVCANNAQNTTRNGTIWIGEGGSSGSTDLPENETDATTTKAAWIEFAETLVLKPLAEDKDADDTGAIGSSETATVATSQTRADTGAVGSSETAVVTAAIPASDTGAIGSSEEATAAASVPADDTGLVAGEESASVAVEILAEDTGLVAGSDEASVEEIAQKQADDDGFVDASESIAITASASADDSGAISGSESVEIAAQVIVADTGSVGASEAVSVRVVAQDGGAVGSLEDIAILATISVDDSGVIAGDDAAAVVAQISAADTGAVSGDDEVSVDATIQNKDANDTGAIAGSETATIAAQVQAADLGVVAAIESVTIDKGNEPIIAADAGFVGATESVSIVARVDAWETVLIQGISDVLGRGGIHARMSVSDEAHVGSIDAASVVKLNEPRGASDTGHIAATETVSVRAFIPANDVAELLIEEYANRMVSGMVGAVEGASFITVRRPISSSGGGSDTHGVGTIEGEGTPGLVIAGDRNV